MITNSELTLYETIKAGCTTIFDVGCCNDSPFLDETKDVHYFEPVKELLDNLQQKCNKNTKAFFNNFGLGKEDKSLLYHCNSMSFVERPAVFTNTPASSLGLPPTQILSIQRADKYIEQNNIQCIDFLKIDVEGFELDVLKGFENYLNMVKYIQFEYGGTYADNNITYNDVTNHLKKFGFNVFYELVDFQPIEQWAKMPDAFNDDFTYRNIACYNQNLVEGFNQSIFSIF
jgi:FkbM family methyltransferase